jgi:hypothetical protein
VSGAAAAPELSGFAVHMTVKSDNSNRAGAEGDVAAARNTAGGRQSDHKAAPRSASYEP